MPAASNDWDKSETLPTSENEVPPAELLPFIQPVHDTGLDIYDFGATFPTFDNDIQQPLLLEPVEHASSNSTLNDFDFSAGMGLGLPGEFNFDLDPENIQLSDMDFAMAFTSTGFDYQAAYMDAALSLGPREGDISLGTYHRIPRTMPDSDANTVGLGPVINPEEGEANASALTLPPIAETDQSNISELIYMQLEQPLDGSEDIAKPNGVRKRKKAQEVDEKHILPPDSRRVRNKSAKALGSS
jgi:hypothetical protein